MSAIALIAAVRWYRGRAASADLALPIIVLAILCVLSATALLRDPLGFAELYTMM